MKKRPAWLARLAYVLAAASLHLWAAAARADGLADEAEINFRLGAERYQAGAYREALVYFLASNRLVPNRNVKYNTARTFERLQQFSDAYRWYLDALDGENDPGVQRNIRDALARIAPNVAILDVTTNPPGATVYVDRRDLGSVATTPRPLALAPGRYHVLVSLAGYEDAQSDELDARVGQSLAVHFDLVRIVGRVHVQADALTAVRVDDENAEPACVAPCDLDLSPGPHLLHFARHGYRIAPRQVTVTARETQTIRAVASPLTGSIVVTADEREALVEVDGVSMGFTPAVVPNVPVGRRHVRVTLRGYEPIERDVEVREGEQADLRDLRLTLSREITTASRLPEQLEDAPSSISVISAGELEAFRYPTIYEALRGTRGMALSFDSAYSSIAVRGLGQPNDYGNRLLILQDGAMLNDNILYQSYTGYDGRVDLGDVERIEIVRGPGSVLYGTGAVSGVVNLITRDRDEPTGGEASVSTYADGIARGRVSGRLTGPHAGLVMSASAARGGGQDTTMIIDGVRTTAHDVDRFEAATVMGRAWLRSVSAQWFLTSRDQRIPTGAFGTRFDDLRTRWRDTRGLVELRFEPRLSSTLRLFARAHANFYKFTGDYAYDGAAEGDPATLNVERYLGGWSGAELRVVYEPKPRVRFTLGVDGQTSFLVRLDGHADVEGANTSYLHENRSYRTGAAYALAEASITRWLRISAGARVDSWSTFGLAVNPRLALIFKLSDVDVVKVMGGQAFRAPSPYELYYNDGGQTQVRSDYMGNELAPETVLSGEIEYSHRFGRDWTLLLSGHAQRARNIVETVRTGSSTDPSMPSPFYYRNSDIDVYTAGGDVELRRDFRGGWSFAAMYGYLEARYASEPMDAGTTSTRITNAPRHFASARGVLPLGSTGLSLAARATLEGPRRISLESDAETSPAVIADLVLSGRSREHGLTYAIGLYNVFDWRYQVPVADTFATRVLPQLGRSFLAHLGLTF